MRARVMGEINIKGFSGMNNILERFIIKNGVVNPRVILNADVSTDGSLIKRAGKTLFIPLSGSHSLWSGNQCCLCVANNILYRIVQGVAIVIGVVTGPKYPFSYVDAENKVYISNPYWQGVFDPTNNSLLSWGIDLPPGPMLLTGDGGLPAGTYHVCMTNITSGKISGNGPISDITLTTPGGIQILNRPTEAIVWATDADESQFYLVGPTSKIVDIPTVEPLPSFLCSPPPFLDNLCYAFGRIWGSVGPDVYYSLPFKPWLFKLTSNKYSFEDTVTMIAKVSTGLYIGMSERTRFLAGTIPEQMTQSDAGAGSIKGTLAYCNNLPELGWTLGTPEKDFADIPIWLTTEGVVVGGPSGKFFNVSKNKVKMSISGYGASLYRNHEGVIQFLTTFKQGKTGSGIGSDDPNTYNAFKDGKIDVHEAFPSEMGSRVSFSDDVTCEVRRGGVLI